MKKIAKIFLIPAISAILNLYNRFVEGGANCEN